MYDSGYCWLIMYFVLILVQNGIGAPVAAQQQQKMIENLLAEQVVRNPTTHDKIGLSFRDKCPLTSKTSVQSISG